MHAHDAEPLPADLWLREMMALATDCAGSSLMAQDHAVRRAYYLCCLCPVPLRPLLWSPLSEEEIEALLAKGDFDAAAARIVGQTGTSIVVQLNPASGYEARLETDDPAQAAFVARLPVLAMIGAWARFFSEPRMLP